MQVGKSKLICDMKGGCGESTDTSIGEMSQLTEDFVCPKCGKVICTLKEIKEQLKVLKGILKTGKVIEEIFEEKGIDTSKLPQAKMTIKLKNKEKNGQDSKDSK